MTAAVRDPSRLTARKWYLMSAGWTLVLIPWVIVAVTSDRPWPVRVLLAAVVLAYAACYIWGVYAAMMRYGRRFTVGLLVGMVVLWLALVVGIDGAGSGALYTVSFAVVAIIALVPPPHGAVTAAVVCAAGIAGVWLRTGTFDLGQVITMAAIILAMTGMFGLIRANTALRDAREELATLAVTAERERMARDLHDVLGHSLTTITVKAGLARRLLESGDAERAADEVTDMERLGRQALAEVRSTVSANRVASLAREIAVAGEALRAAEIEADLPVAVDDVPPERQQAFAHVVREGVTNAIRHSGASRCTVRLTPTSVEVCDDGVGSPADTPAGNGISGLTERLAAIGGWVDAGPLPGGGYRLRAECLPSRKRART
ncbi:sensor histidine kinase [Pseudonocardia sp.]|uniref:sensor histidine kinase n=1 Tax=Pseudonocardia sp. TaxID=60912 RepID=UPI00261931CD|nr:sensor histidine kinase [Pseudonocardia sp.]MCW2721509.1 histidine kinase [Pseudonocardia sp.]